jgi:hypothetical protein
MMTNTDRLKINKIKDFFGGTVPLRTIEIRDGHDKKNTGIS